MDKENENEKTPEEGESSEDEEEVKALGSSLESETGVSRNRRRTSTPDRPQANPVALYKASELASRSVEIADVKGYLAAGALSHANVKGDDKISVEEFKKICKEFSNAKAF